MDREKAKQVTKKLENENYTTIAYMQHGADRVTMM